MNSTDLQEHKDKLEEILSRDEFTAYHQKQGGENPILRWIGKGFSKLLDLLPGIDMPGGASPAVSKAIMIVLLILLAIAIFWICRRIIAGRKPKRAIIQEDKELERSYRHHWSDALALADREAYREAVRSAFLALLMYMHEKDWVRAEKWKTNYEYANELWDRQPGAVTAFREAAALFDRVFYGKAAVGPAEFSSLLTWLKPYIEEAAAYANSK